MRTVWWAKKNETVSGRKADGGKGGHYYIRMRKMRGRVCMRVCMGGYAHTHVCVYKYEGHT